MKVLLCHSYYMQRGGEDISFEEERALLQQAGHDVVEYVRRNDEIGGFHALKAAGVTIWNSGAAREIRGIVQREKPDILHVTNTFPLLSPAVLGAARAEGTAVVQGVHNFRNICAGAYLMRNNRPCEDCIGHAVPWPAVVHRCYRDSFAATAAVATMQMVHRGLATWRDEVDAFFAPSEFARTKLVEGGFPAERFHVKYNSVDPDPGLGTGGDQVAFVGRLSPEKGVRTLLAAWQSDKSLPRLVIVGDGPLGEEVAAAAAKDSRIVWRGAISLAEVHQTLRGSHAIVVPSVWYETFGRTIVEGFAAGAIVVASRLGAMAELVEDGRTGFTFEPGDAASLASAVHRVWSLDAEAVDAIRRSARRRFESRFRPEHNYQRLIEVYEAAIERRWGGRRALPARLVTRGSHSSDEARRSASEVWTQRRERQGVL